MVVKVQEAGSLTEAKELVVKKTSSTNFSTSSWMMTGQASPHRR